MSDRPTSDRLAVALAYEEGSAPRVTAAGSGEIAETILRLAEENDVPIEENALLAATLASVPLGEEIPEELYKAVAAVIGFILRARPSAVVEPINDDAPSGPAD